MAISIPFLRGSGNPEAELTHAKPYSPADRMVPIALYTQTIVLFLGIVVFRQMANEPRPLPAPLVNQRVQAWAGIVLALIGVVFIYLFVWLRGPGGPL
jgi:hypothetical protein